jgi:hypothetical protein
MPEKNETADRVAAYSDAVFALVRIHAGVGRVAWPRQAMDRFGHFPVTGFWASR